MSALPLVATGLAAALGVVSIGGGLYELAVVDPAWPTRPDIVQPSRGGISRKRFWIPAHIAFELTLVGALILTWSSPDVRFWLLLALASHAVMRIWSAVDFIPKALAFERPDSGPMSADAARRWTRRSVLRLPLDLVTGCSMLVAFATLARMG